MENDSGYIEKLAIALEQKEHHIERNDALKMKEALRSFHASVQGILKVLLEKGLIKEDPYHYEQKISDIAIPPSDPFPESEKQTHLSVRLTAFVDQLDFLVNFYNLSVNALDLKKVKIILGLIDYIRWVDFSPNSSSLMTRYTAQFIDRLHQGEDQMASRVLASSITVLRDKALEIKKALKIISDYHREVYKLNIRKFVIPESNLKEEDAEFNKEQGAKKIKTAMNRLKITLPFYKELIFEIFDEDYGPNSERIRSEILDNLVIKKDVMEKKKEDPEKKMRQLLMTCINGFTITEPQLELVYSKMRDNSRLLENRSRTFGQKLASWFSNIFHSGKTHIEYDIHYKDPFTSLKKAETLNFTEYLKTIHQKWALYRNLVDKNSPTYTRVTSATNDQLYEFIAKNIHDLKNIYRRIIGLDQYFKTNVDPEDKNEIRGMKVEAVTLKRLISNLAKDLSDFTSYREEVEQFKKLGIDVNND